MYCPYCGKPLVKLSDGTYSCESGNMQLPLALSRKFQAHFEDHSEPTPDFTSRYVSGPDGPTHWFCPNCGSPMQAKDGAVLCNRCNVNITRYVHWLVEACFHQL